MQRSIFPDRLTTTLSRILLLMICASISACARLAPQGGGRTAAPVRGSPPLKLSAAGIPWPAARKILQRIQAPIFPHRRFSVIRYGAVGNGVHDDTRAISRTVSACAAAGGGEVIVPRGTYLTGAILLKSGVNLHVSRGATLLFSGNRREYPLRLSRNQGIDLINFSPCIYACSSSAVALTGHGVLDGRLTGRWDYENNRSWHRLERMRDTGVRIADRVFGASHPLGAAMVEFYDCRNVLISGIHVVNACWWQLHPTLCRNVTIRNVHTDSTHGNSDGCDVDSCRDVWINHCTFFAGDDCISLKSGRDPDKFRSPLPCRDIVITDCRFAGPWGMISCGSEESEGVEHVFGWDLHAVQHGRFNGVRYALYAKANSVRGGFVRDVHLGNIHGRCFVAFAHLTLVYGPHHGHNFPIFSGIHFRDIRGFSAPELLFLVGIPHDFIGPLTMTNCRFTGITHRNQIYRAPHVALNGVWVNGRAVKSP